MDDTQYGDVNDKKKCRSWIFTMYQYTDADEAIWHSMECTYIIYGHEVCPSTGNKHLQGWIYFKDARTKQTLYKAFGRKFYLHRPDGPPKAQQKYCSKEATDIYERGVCPMSQKEKGETERERHAAAYRLIKEGKADEIPDDMQFKYHRNIDALKRKFMPEIPDAEDVTGLWIWGEAGCGKSRKARQDYPGAYKKLCNKWWDGYLEQEYVIIDDFGLDHKCLGHHLKIWGDRYAFLAEVKGSAMMIRPKKIVVTSQYSIDRIFEDEETRSAINRRFFSINMATDNQ